MIACLSPADNSYDETINIDLNIQWAKFWDLNDNLA